MEDKLEERSQSRISNGVSFPLVAVVEILYHVEYPFAITILRCENGCV